MIALDLNGSPIFPYFLTIPRLSCNYFTGGLDSRSVQVITEFVSTSLSAPNTQIPIKLAQWIPSHPVTRRIDYPSSAKGHFGRQKSMAVTPPINLELFLPPQFSSTNTDYTQQTNLSPLQLAIFAH
jgi:hypothetical protein